MDTLRTSWPTWFPSTICEHLVNLVSIWSKVVKRKCVGIGPEASNVYNILIKDAPSWKLETVLAVPFQCIYLLSAIAIKIWSLQYQFQLYLSDVHLLRLPIDNDRDKIKPSVEEPNTDTHRARHTETRTHTQTEEHRALVHRDEHKNTHTPSQIARQDALREKLKGWWESQEAYYSFLCGLTISLLKSSMVWRQMSITLNVNINILSIFLI